MNTRSRYTRPSGTHQGRLNTRSGSYGTSVNTTQGLYDPNDISTMSVQDNFISGASCSPQFVVQSWLPSFDVNGADSDFRHDIASPSPGTSRLSPNGSEPVLPLPPYPCSATSDEDDATDDTNYLLTPDFEASLVTDNLGQDSVPSISIDRGRGSSSKHFHLPKTPHRKDIEAKARNKMRQAAAHLRNAISPYLDGATLRGNADVMEEATKLISYYNTRIADLERQLAAHQNGGYYS